MASFAIAAPLYHPMPGVPLQPHPRRPDEVVERNCIAGPISDIAAEWKRAAAWPQEMTLSDTAKIALVVAAPIGSFVLLFTLALLWRRYRARSGHFRAGVWDPNTPSQLQADWSIQAGDGGSYATAKPIFELPPHPALGQPDEKFCHECRARLHTQTKPEQAASDTGTAESEAISTLVEPTFSEKTFRMTRIASDPQMDRKTSICTVASDLTGDGDVGQRDAVSIASGFEGAYASSDALGGQYGRKGSVSTLSTLVGGRPSYAAIAQLGYPLRKISIAQGELPWVQNGQSGTIGEADDEMDELDEVEEEKLRYTVDMGERRPSALSVAGSMMVRKISAGGAEDAISIQSGLVPDVPPAPVAAQASTGEDLVENAGPSRSSTIETLETPAGGEAIDGRPTSLYVPGLRDSWAVSPAQVELAERVSLVHAKPDLHRTVQAPAIATQQGVNHPIEHVGRPESAGVFATNNPFRLDVPQEERLSRGDKRRSVELSGVPHTATLEVEAPVSPKTPVPPVSPDQVGAGPVQLPSIVISSETRPHTPPPRSTSLATNPAARAPDEVVDKNSMINLSSSSALARLAIGSTTAAAAALLGDSIEGSVNKPRRLPLHPKSPKIRPDSLVLVKTKRRGSASHEHHLPHWLKTRRKTDPSPCSPTAAEADVPEVRTAPLDIKKRRHTLSAAMGLPRIARSPLPVPPSEHLSSELPKAARSAEEGMEGGEERPKSAGAGSPADFGVFDKWQSFAPSRPVLKDKRRPSALSLKESNQPTESGNKKAEKHITHLADLVAATEAATEPNRLLSVGAESRSRRESWVLDTPAGLRESMSAEPLRNSLLLASAGPATARMTPTAA